MRFLERLDRAIRKNESLLCIGLDPDLERLPAHLLEGRSPAEAVLEFNRRIIEATCDLASGYKFNLAFYEALGPEGLEALRCSVELVPPELITIGDGKRGDVAHTSRAYARALFEVLGFGAVTASPYLGLEALEPLLSWEDRGVFVLCRTSNPGAAQFQSLGCAPSGKPLYLTVAEAVARANERFGNLGLVVGATWPEELRQVREAVGEEPPLLIPGVGAQAGDLELAVRYGTNSRGERALIASSRGVIFASSGEDFAEAARAAALRLKDEIDRCRGV